MEVHGSPFFPGTPDLSHPVRKRENHGVTNRKLTHSFHQSSTRSRPRRTFCEEVLSPCTGREHCHRRRCRRTHPQVGSGGWGRRTRWLQPLLWSPPLFLKAPDGSSVRTPDGKMKYSSWNPDTILLKEVWNDNFLLNCELSSKEDKCTSKFPSRLRLAGGALALNSCCDSSVQPSLFGHTLRG